MRGEIVLSIHFFEWYLGRKGPKGMHTCGMCSAVVMDTPEYYRIREHAEWHAHQEHEHAPSARPQVRRGIEVVITRSPDQSLYSKAVRDA